MTDQADQPLSTWAQTWRPTPEKRTERLEAGPITTLAALFDQPTPVRAEGDPVPALWNWLYFLDRTPQSELAADGHPRDGNLVPPIPRRRRMFAGGRLNVIHPLRVGDIVVRESEVTQVRHTLGRSGELLFVIVRHRFSVDGQLRLEEQQDVVYRQRHATEPATPGAGTDPAAATGSAPERAQRSGPPSASSDEADTVDTGNTANTANTAEAGDWRMTLQPDATLLFRFSALTFNAHRIHYDQAYATGVEGYPGLVVHGPLLALGMLEPLRRTGAFVEHVAYRFHQPVFCDQQVVFTGTRTANDAELGATAGYRAATARVRIGSQRSA